MTEGMTEEEYERHLENLRNSGIDGGLGFDQSNSYISDEMRYTDGIIRDDLYNLIQEGGILEQLCLKKRTVDNIRSQLLVSTTFEKVLNNYSDRDVMRENMGVQMNTILTNVQLSGLEKKYLDANMMMLTNEIHHRTKVLRGKGGFERGIQKTNIVKSTARSILSSKSTEEQAKSGISRYLQGGKR